MTPPSPPPPPPALLSDPPTLNPALPPCPACACQSALDYAQLLLQLRRARWSAAALSSLLDPAIFGQDAGQDEVGMGGGGHVRGKVWVLCASVFGGKRDSVQECLLQCM